MKKRGSRVRARPATSPALPQSWQWHAVSLTNAPGSRSSVRLRKRECSFHTFQPRGAARMTLMIAAYVIGF